MTPIEKRPNSTVAPFSLFPKTRSEAPARPPLVELEIPVTIHSDRIVEGSDKREPFSETTRTVLVSSHGALVRLATTLVPGQRISLFNEKTRKEIACQVVKHAPSGSASGFVELQFSEPDVGFWDLPIPVAPPASVSAPPIAPANLETIPPVSPAAAKAAAPKPIAPASPAIPRAPVAPSPAISTPSLRDFSKEINALVVAAMAAAPKPVAPVPTFIEPVSPTVAPPPLPVVRPAHATRQSVASTNSTPQRSVVPPVAAPLTPKISSAQAGTTPTSPLNPPAPAAPNPSISASSLLDFSKEIAVRARTNAPGSPQVSLATSASHPSPASSQPPVEQSMLLATSLEASLDTPHFSATPPAWPAPSAPTVTQTEPPAAQAAKTVLEFAQSEPKPVFKSESESFLPGHQQIPPSVSVEFLPGVSVSSEESIDVLVVEEPRRWHTDRPDSGLLGKSPVRPDQVTSASPKKALTLGLAASVLLLLGTGTFYLRQNHAATTTPATAGALNTPSSPASLQPAKNSTRIRSQAASATPATSQPPSAPIAERLSASAVVEPSAPPAPVGPAPAPAATLDPQPAANPPAAELQPTVSTSGFATAGASDAAPEPAPADVPATTMEVAGETPQPRPGVQLGGFERPLAELAAFDPDRHRVSLGEHEGQAFQQGQHPGCTKNVTLGSVGKEKLYLGIPEWASRWLEKNSKKLPGICFSDSPMSGAQNFLIVFDTSVAPSQTELLSTSSSAASWPEGQGAFTTSYGSTWHYNHNETVGTTVTSLLDDCPHSHPAHVSHAMAYTEEGMPISQRRSPTETKKSKESSVKPTSAKPGKTQDESTGAYRELDALLYLVVTDIEKW